MTHAFLIIAHTDPAMLQTLVTALDAPDHVLLLHWDKKAGRIPDIEVRQARWHVMRRRIDVRWGDTSQIRTELALLTEALAEVPPCDWYHIISGNHMPVRPLEDLPQWLENHPAAVFQHQDINDYQIELKMQHFNLFTHTLKHRIHAVEHLSQRLWSACHKLQRLAGFRRHRGERFVTASNWCTLSREAAEYLVSRRRRIARKYRFTFCGDEFFIPTELSLSPMQHRLSWRTDYLFTDIGRANARLLDSGDREAIEASGCFWARKFSSDTVQFLLHA